MRLIEILSCKRYRDFASAQKFPYFILLTFPLRFLIQEILKCHHPERAILAFGGERAGLSSELMAAAERRVSIPMAAGVSSLNLATAVAVVLYSGKFGQ